MRITRIGYALGVAAAVAMFAGCSSNGSSLGPIMQAPGQTQSIVRNHPVTMFPGAVLRGMSPVMPYHGKNWAAPDAGSGTLVYACEFFGGFCNWYKSGHNTIVGTVAASYPNGLCDDAAGNVYIPDGGTAHVFEYAKGGTTVIKDFDNTSQGQPASCTVDRNGTLYVGNIASDTVSVYVLPSLTPSRVLKVPHAHTGGPVGSGFVVGVSVDENHLLAVTWVINSTSPITSGLDEYPNAHGSGVTKISLPSGDFGGGAMFDNAENLAYNDQSAGTTGIYKHGTFASCNSFSTSSGDAVSPAMNKANTKVAEGDAVNGAVYEESFGDCTGGGTVSNTINAGLTGSGAVSGQMYDPGSQL
jgi:hypothetical protein